MFTAPPMILASLIVNSFLFLLVLVSLGMGALNFMLLQRLREEMRSKRTAEPVPAPVAQPAPAPKAAAQSAPAPVAAPTPAASAPALDAPVIVLIAAAVHAALAGQPHRILHIEPVSGGWAREGRREIFSSRRVR